MRWPFLNKIVSSGFFYLGWIVCLQEAHEGRTCYGFIIIACVIAYYLYTSSSKKADYILLGIVFSVGPLSDVLYAKCGLLDYHSCFPSISCLPPLWVFFLWGLFGVNIHVFSWLNKHMGLASVLGAIGGPSSYFSVIKLGGASLLAPLSTTMLVIGGVWAIFLPFFIWLNGYLKQKFD